MMLKLARMAVTSVAVTLLFLAGTAQAADPDYVALGDSYTSAPLVLPVASGAPLLCLQSAVNYPHLAAAQRGLSLKDVSCAGATTSDMTSSQYPGVGPQFDALTGSTRAVTVGIGGNDDGLFIGAIVTCTGLDALNVFDIGAPCRDTFGSTFNARATEIGPRVGALIPQIKQRSPNAKVFVVGYPAIVPQHGRCYPQVPLTTGDTTFLDGLTQRLNASIKAAATANGATFVDLYTPSVGHDACKSSSVRWVEPPIPGNVAAPVHPNTTGEQKAALQVTSALQAAGF